jgi:hypothetical protein
MSPDLAPTAHEVAARIAGSAQIVAVRMLSTSAAVERPPEEGEILSWSLDESINSELVDQFGLAVVGAYTLRIAAVRSSETGAGVPVGTIEFVLAALYDLSDLGLPAPAVHEVSSFASTTGAMALYPFAREYVQNLTGRLGLPPLVLPVKRVPSPWHAARSVKPAKRAKPGPTTGKAR